MRLDGARLQRTLGCIAQSTTLTLPRTIDLASPFLIGDVEIATRVVLAPMAGVSVQAFRRQGRRFGAGLVCSEMVSACGLSYGNARTLGYLRIARDEHPLAVQVFGSDPATVAEAARMCETAGADIIDINFGCPVRKVTKTGAGASALDNHDIAVAVTRAVAEAVAVPVTVKLRRGVRNGARDCLVLGPKLAAVGAQAITLHPRSAQQMYTGRADHALTAELVELVDIPVLASGDITTRAGAQAVLAQTGASAVMIARGAQGDPWLLAELVDGIRREPSDAELVGELVRFVREVAREMTPERAVGWLRKFYGWYLRGGRLGPGMRSALAQAKSIDEVERLLLEACPAAQSLVDQGEREIAALGAIEDDELLDLPISIYSAG
jgi:nifR3 family TIM-barrel protein